MPSRTLRDCVGCGRQRKIREFARCSECASEYGESPAFRRSRRRDGEHDLANSWQAFGRYLAAPEGRFHGNEREPIFASPVRASNRYMAEWRVLQSVFPYEPTVDSLRRVRPR